MNSPVKFFTNFVHARYVLRRAKQVRTTATPTGVVLTAILLLAIGCEQSQTDPKNTQTNPDSASQSTTDTDSQPKSASNNSSDTHENSENQIAFNTGEFDWPQYRGSDGRSVQHSKHLPRKWSDEEGMRWKAELPGRGSSSPIVVRDRVFVTAFTGYGISPTDRGSVGNLRMHVICKNRNSGQTIWQRNIRGSMLTQRLNENLLGHGFASSTPVTDGELVYVFFATSGVFAFDMDGKLVWEQNVGWQNNPFGPSASLTTYKDMLIVNASLESKSIYALDRKTGKGIWKIDEIDRCWSMPVFGEAADGSIEMVVSEEDTVRGYNPDTGELRWTCEGVHNYIIAVPWIEDGIVYCNGGLERQMMAIKLGGRGDVTETHKLWEVPQGANVASPLIENDIMFLAHDSGIMESYDTKTGKRLKRTRTGSRERVYSSPFLSGDTIYLPTRDAGVMLLHANQNIAEVGRNKIKSDESEVHSSLAANGDRFFIRTDKYLYCLGNHKKPADVIKHNSAVDQTAPIRPKDKLDFDPDSNRMAPYCYYLVHDVNALTALMLSPYKNVITEEQTETSKGIVKDNLQPFTDLQNQRNEVLWKLMQGKIDETAAKKELKTIDDATIKHSSVVRILIKKLFSKAQMDQHKLDAAEWQRQQKEKNEKREQEKAEKEKADKAKSG